MVDSAAALAHGLGDQTLQFVQTLRRVGLAAGSGQALDAVRVLSIIDLTRRDDVYAALRAVLLDAHAHEPVFAAAFDRFWSGMPPAINQEVGAPVGYAPSTRRRSPSRDNGTGARRLLTQSSDAGPDGAGAIDAVRGPDDPALAYSGTEALRHKDFADLTPRELAEMRRLMAGLIFVPPERRLRRSEASARGPLLDLRRVARRNLRYGGEVLVLPRRHRKTQVRPLVLICDVSGSMDRYTRMLLRFTHAATQWLGFVETFVFGTRLTRITRQLRTRNPDRAIDEVAHDVLDFSGGTRIGEAVAAFNRRWARRALGRGAIAVIISDGWDRGDPALLATEMAHLQRSCHLLAWLNPLLGVDGYQPLTRGMSAALPHVDLFLPAHNLASLEALATMLARLGDDRPVRGAHAAELPRAG